MIEDDPTHREQVIDMQLCFLKQCLQHHYLVQLLYILFLNTCCNTEIWNNQAAAHGYHGNISKHELNGSTFLNVGHFFCISFHRNDIDHDHIN